MRRNGAAEGAKPSQEASCQSEHPDRFEMIEIPQKGDQSQEISHLKGVTAAKKAQSLGEGGFFLVFGDSFGGLVLSFVAGVSGSISSPWSISLDGKGRRKTGLEIGQSDVLCGAVAEEKENLIFLLVASIRIKGNLRI